MIVADVMGKGIPAALLAAATKSHFLEALCHLTAMSRSGELPQPKEIVTLAHADMVRHLIDLESFVTLCYADSTWAATPRPRRLRAHGDDGRARQTGACEILHGDNLPLGIREGRSSIRSPFTFEPGDLLLFYSDGVTEMRNLAGEFFGADRLSECVRSNRALEPDALVNAIRRAAVAFAESDRLTDDLTCVAVRDRRRASDRWRAPRWRSAATSGTCAAPANSSVTSARMLPDRLLDESDVAELELAVNEAASNIMKHAYHGRADQRIQLEAEACPGRVSIRLHHLGRLVRPGRRPAARVRRLAGIRLRRLSDHQERGRGPVLSRRTREELYCARQDSQLAGIDSREGQRRCK